MVVYIPLIIICYNIIFKSKLRQRHNGIHPAINMMELSLVQSQGSSCSAYADAGLFHLHVLYII